VPWWVWALVLWAVLGTALAVSVGKVVRAADRRELRGQGPARDDDEQTPPVRRRAS
jgi:hypothetical protein